MLDAPLPGATSSGSVLGRVSGLRQGKRVAHLAVNDKLERNQFLNSICFRYFPQVF
jgi:hypothetical protein